jgi:hypothetical protein
MLTDEQIFDILDGNADAELLQQHANLLAHSVVYQQYFNELTAIHFDLAEMPLEKPSANFTENILAALPAEKPVFVFAKKRNWSAKFMYGFFGTMIAVLLMTIVIAIIYQPSNEIALGQSRQIFELFNGFMTSYFTQIAILVNLMALLVVFDRKILRPYFKHRSITLG